MRLKHCVYAYACFIVASFLFPRCFLAVAHQKVETMWKQALFPSMCLHLYILAPVIALPGKEAGGGGVGASLLHQQHAL